MEWTLAAQLILSTARHYLFAQGDHEVVGYIDDIFDAAEAGRNVDAHLENVARFLRTGERIDFAAQRQGLQDEVAEALAPDPAT